MKRFDFIIVGLGVGILIGVAIVLVMKNKKPNPKKVLLLGGLDYRSGDKSIAEQVDLLKDGLTKSSKSDVIGFRYKDYKGIIDAINQSPKSIIVVLFSAGCSKATPIAETMLSKGISLKNLFIVEPYGTSTNTQSVVRKVVSMGVPSKNVMVGNYKAVGLGIVDDATPTPKCSPNHWCSLGEIGKMIVHSN
jgi:hypothetical protein